MAGMLFAGDKTYLSSAIATMTVVGDRHARLADRAAGAAVEARRQIEKGKVPFLTGSAATAAKTGSGGDPDPALRQPVVAAALAGGALSCSPSRCSTSTPRRAASTRCRRARHGRDDRQDPERVLERRRRLPPGRDQGATSTRRPMKRGDRSSEGAGARTRPDDRADRRRDQRCPHRRSVDDPARGQGHGQHVDRGAGQLRNGVLPATIGKVPGATYAVSGPTAASADRTRC